MGKWTFFPFFDFQQAFFESNNSIQFGFGKLASRGLVRSAPPAAQVDLSGWLRLHSFIQLYTWEGPPSGSAWSRSLPALFLPTKKSD